MAICRTGYMPKVPGLVRARQVVRTPVRAEQFSAEEFAPLIVVPDSPQLEVTLPDLPDVRLARVLYWANDAIKGGELVVYRGSAFGLVDKNTGLLYPMRVNKASSFADALRQVTEAITPALAMAQLAHLAPRKLYLMARKDQPEACVMYKDVIRV